MPVEQVDRRRQSALAEPEHAMPALGILHIIARLPVIGASRDQGSTLHRCSGAMFQVTMRERRVHAHPPRVGRPDWIILA
jgi:hypothetical protein